MIRIQQFTIEIMSLNKFKYIDLCKTNQLKLESDYTSRKSLPLKCLLGQTKLN